MPSEATRFVKRTLVRAVLAMRGSVPERPVFEGPLRSIAILAQEKLGDAILLTPLIRNLRRAHPDLEIHVVTFSHVHTFFEMDPDVTAVHRANGRSAAVRRAFQSRTFDLVFNTKDHFSYTFVTQSRRIKARYRVGIAHPQHRGFYQALLPLDFYMHVVEKHCALLDYLQIPYTREEMRPSLPPAPVSEPVAEFALCIAERRPVGINLSAGAQQREWPLEHWMKLVDTIRKPIVVFAMPERFDDKRRIESAFDHVIPSPETPTIFDAARLVAHLSLLISPDTSLVHVASCCNTPVAGLYRNDPVHTRRFYPFLVAHKMVISETNQIIDIVPADVIQAVCDMITVPHTIVQEHVR